MISLARLPTFDDSIETRQSRAPRLRTRYYAFLSYSHKDKELADWLHRELEKFRVPHSIAGKLTANGVVPRRLTPIFRDEQDLSAGGDLAQEIKAALAASQFLVVLCSPTAAKSRWTNQEIESFKRTRPEGCVLAAVVAGEPFASDIPGREAEECFPPALRYKYDRRGHQTTKRAEPLAADFREAGEGRRRAFLKLIAGMLGVGLDDLVQREQTRHHRRLAWLAAGSLAGMAVTSALAVTAFEARNAAREQRREAEGLVEFMVGDLRSKLEPIGKLDTLDGVGSRVLAYYSKQDASDLADDALLQRSQALNLMAEVAFKRGNLLEAKGLYQQAMAGTAEAVARSPNDPKRLFDHAQNVFYVGEMARYGGEPAQAEAAYREYKRLADNMSALEPDNLKYRMEVLYANEDLGISIYDQHRFQEAIAQLQSVAGPMATLMSLYPANLDYQKEFATVLAWSADAQRSAGNLAKTVDLRQRQIATLTPLAAQAGDSDARSRIITAHQGLGIVLAESGQTERGLAELRTAVDEANQLIPIEPRNAFWKRIAAAAHLDLARVLMTSGKKDEAAQHAQVGCALSAALPATFSSSERTRLQITCSTLRSRLAQAAGDMGGALAFAQEALRASRSIHTQDPITDHYQVASSYRLVGEIKALTGDRQGAMDAWNSALAVLPPNVTERPLEMNERAQLLTHLGRDSEARPLAARLASIGYRSVF